MRTRLTLMVTLAGLLGCTPLGPMAYHRATLDDMARGNLDCAEGALEVRDITPEGFRYAWDPDAKRYEVRACGRVERFLCYDRAEDDDPRAECRSLDRPHSGEEVHLGPWQVR